MKTQRLTRTSTEEIAAERAPGCDCMNYTTWDAVQQSPRESANGLFMTSADRVHGAEAHVMNYPRAVTHRRGNRPPADAVWGMSSPG